MKWINMALTQWTENGITFSDDFCSGSTEIDAFFIYLRIIHWL